MVRFKGEIAWKRVGEEEELRQVKGAKPQKSITQGEASRNPVKKKSTPLSSERAISIVAKEVDRHVKNLYITWLIKLYPLCKIIKVIEKGTYKKAKKQYSI